MTNTIEDIRETKNNKYFCQHCKIDFQDRDSLIEHAEDMLRIADIEMGVIQEDMDYFESVLDGFEDLEDDLY